ncbi:MAG: hypothetical protein ACYDHU_02800 [Acidimicrobiales bacterium]
MKNAWVVDVSAGNDGAWVPQISRARPAYQVVLVVGGVSVVAAAAECRYSAFENTTETTPTMTIRIRAAYQFTGAFPR